MDSLFNCYLSFPRLASWTNELARQFEVANNGKVKIEIVLVKKFYHLYSDIVNEAKSKIGLYDGFITTPLITGSVVPHDGWYDLTDYISESPKRKEDFTDIFNVYGNFLSQYQNRTIMYPIDGDLLNLYYRKDILEYFNISSPPRTWDEYSSIAQRTHGREYFDSTINKTVTLSGSCIARMLNCANAYWANLLISSITQTKGMKTGYLFDSETFDAIGTHYPVLEQVLQWKEQQVMYGAENGK
jgi:maltose-binding protein MalE